MTSREILRGAVADASRQPLATITETRRLAGLLERRRGKAGRDDQVIAAKTGADLERTLGV